MTRYEFDRKSFSIRKATVSVGGVLWRILRAVIVTVSLAVLYYVVLSFFVSTDTERHLARENRAYEREYEALSARLELLESNMDNLAVRDADIYEAIFHTDPPAVDPGAALPVSGSGMPARLQGAATMQGTIAPEPVAPARRAETLSATAAAVEAGFLEVFDRLAQQGAGMPPMQMPVRGLTYAQIGASTGSRISPFYKVAVRHDGIDIIAGQGEAVYATAAGTVSNVVLSGKGLGNVVEIDHGNGYTTRYCHLADIAVTKGQKVTAGRKIAEIGISGNSFAPHLHYEVYRNGTPVDPVNYLFASLDPQEYANVAYMAAVTEQSLD